ncbi:MAG: pyridoxal-phosphate dependent enzyme [Planctomycetaceae bacterium]|nr:pyridoxal-phosphate dependent enzyme [Planctomycetaceae bacterium]
MESSARASALLSLTDIRAAEERIAGRLHRTPLVASSAVSADLGAPTFLKLECLQKTGSFKPRGAFNKLLTLSAEQRSRGVVGVSGGNHAQGLAFAAKSLGTRATICMPRSTPANYLDATRGYGAEIVLCDDISAAFAEGRRLRDAGLVEVHPFDDPLIAAGQGTVGLEILADLPQVSRVYVSIGGGGLIAGVATALKQTRPEIRVIGVETVGADAMARSVAANRLVELPQITSIARTLGAPKVSDFTLHHVQQLVDEMVVVEDHEAFAALKFILERTKYLTEPAAACCLAAARRQRSSFRSDESIAILLCGGNASLADLCVWHERWR